MSLPLRDARGLFPAWAWPGGYPLYYITHGYCTVLCHECASKETEEIVATVEANWEDPMLWCEGCNKRIESAYAEEGHPDEKG